LSRLLLALLLWQAVPQGRGLVTGTVRSNTGNPAARVRVYAMTYRDGAEAATAPPALESQVETDLSGKYSLDLPPGRYYIASGSLAAPTYYPGTSDITAARILTVAANGVTPNIDFGSFVPANRNPGGLGIQLSPPGNSTISGVLRYPDGSPASGVRVGVLPASMMPGAGTPASMIVTGTVIYQTTSVVGGQVVTRILSGGGAAAAVSDNTGAYRIPSLAAETYYIAAGYAEAPAYYPGTSDLKAAKTVVLPANATVDKMDFTIPVAPPGVTIKGTISTPTGAPASAAGIRLRPQTTPVSNMSAVFGLPTRGTQKEGVAEADGTFSFSDVIPGTYQLEAMFSGIGSPQQVLTITGQPVDGLKFVLPIAQFSGRILMEDGSPVPDPQVFREAIVTTVNSPNIISSTLLPITAAGTFARIIEADEFRFYLRVLPEEYEIKSMRFGTADLLKETLKITGTTPVYVDVRVAKRTAAGGGVRATGSVLDSVTGQTATAERVTLCCQTSGPVDRFSAPLAADGTFAFAGIPPGKYETGVETAKGTPNLYLVTQTLDVGDQGASGAALFTTMRFGQLTATIIGDGATALPANLNPKLVFTTLNGKVRVAADRNPTGMYIASVPLGAKYDVIAEGLPEGYAVKSVLGSAEPSATTTTGLNPNPLVVVIEKK
jgi:hypothetical protein